MYLKRSSLFVATYYGLRLCVNSILFFSHALPVPALLLIDIFYASPARLLFVSHYRFISRCERTSVVARGRIFCWVLLLVLLNKSKSGNYLAHSISNAYVFFGFIQYWI